jgi:hypothetical protein
LSAEFRKEAERMVTLVREESRPKHIKGKTITLEDFFQLARDYTAAINAGGVPQIQNSL